MEWDDGTQRNELTGLPFSLKSERWAQELSLGILFPNLGHVSLFLPLTRRLRGTEKKKKIK